MVVKLYSCVLAGFDLRPVTVEVDLANQLPSFSLVGLASSMTQESRERVRAAVRNSDFDWPSRKVTVNLIPTDLPKWGSHFELPMALGVLLASDALRCELNGRIFALGELSLDGEIRPLGMSAAIARRLLLSNRIEKASVIVAHPDDVTEFSKHLGPARARFDLIGVQTLRDAASALQGLQPLSEPVREATSIETVTEKADPLALLKEVQGEPLAVLASLVALAHDRHHLLLVGPHGVGKSMLARALGNAQGDMDPAEAIERSLIDPHADSRKPVVQLQSTLSRAALEGSVLKSGQPLPGEISRAHGGLLIMDEFLELRRDALESLRQPLEEGVVRIQRAQVRTTLPARFQLVATSNLCPCGKWPSIRSLCRCPQTALTHYQRKFSGPLLDRFDMIVLLAQPIVEEKLVTRKDCEFSKLALRLLDNQGWQTRLNGARHARPKLADPDAEAHIDRELLSRRGLGKILSVAKTLAALDGVQQVEVAHIRLAKLLRVDIERVLNSNSLRSLEYFSL